MILCVSESVLYESQFYEILFSSFAILSQYNQQQIIFSLTHQFSMDPKKWTIFMYLANGTDRNDENANKIEKKIAKTLQVVRWFYVVLVCAWKTNFQMPVTVTYKSHTYSNNNNNFLITSHTSYLKQLLVNTYGWDDDAIRKDPQKITFIRFVHFIFSWI